MQHVATNQACLAVLVLVLVVTVNVAECKSRGPKIRTRGCAFYGHSCFGGHGKRSMPVNVNLGPAQRPEHGPEMKFLQEPMHLEVPGSYDNNIEESSYSDEAPEQDFKFAVYGLFKQWMNDIRTARKSESDSLSRNSAAYELLKASSAAAAKKDADGQH